MESPQPAALGALASSLDVRDLQWARNEDAQITWVVPPECVARHRRDRLLYNQSPKRLESAPVGREHTVIADVPRSSRALTGGARPKNGVR